MVSDTEIQQERIRQERRRRGEGDVTEDLLWAGAFDPYTAPVTPVSYGNTGLTVTNNTPVTQDRSESPVTSTVDPSVDTSSMIGDSTITSAGPSMMMLPDASAGGSMTINADNLGEEANREQYEFWSNANANGVSDLDASIFTGELTEDALLENESFLRAAETVYDMRHGEGAWAAKVAEEGWSAQEAAEELGSNGLDYISDFNFQLWEAGRTGLTIGSKTQEQQIALLYMMRAVEHKNMSWAGAGRAAMSMVTDPVNIGITAISVLLAIPTFGGSLAVGGAAIAGRGVVGTAVAKAGQVAFMRSLTSTVQGQVTRLAASRVVQGVANSAVTQGTRRVISGAVNNQATRMITNNVVTRTIGNSAAGRAFNSEIARRAGRYAVVPSMMDSYYTDRMVFNAENAGTQALGYDPMEYSWQRGAFAIGMGGTMGYGMGRVFGAGGQLVGDGFRRAFRRTASEVTPDEAVTRAATTGATEEPTVRSGTTNESPRTTTRAGNNETSTTAGTTRTTTEGPNGRVDGDMDGPFTPGDRTAFASASTKSFFNRGVPSSATTPSGIAIPDYRQGTNWMTYWLKRSWNPYKLFTRWTNANPRSAPVDATPVLRPLISTVDEAMQKHGLVDAIRTLQNDMNGLAKRLEENPGNRAAIQQDIDARIAKFSQDNKTALQAFEADVDAIRTHVKNTYVTEAEYRKMHNLSDKDKLPKDVTVVMSKSDGRKTGLVHVVDENGNVSFSHRDAVLDYLSDMKSISQNLQQADFGNEGARIRNLSSVSDPLEAAREISNSLNKLEEVATGAHKRLHPNGYSWQEIEILERTLHEGYYNPYSRKGKVGDTNVEHTWQQLEDRFREYLDENEKIVKWGVDGSNDFVDKLVEIYDTGLDHEAVYTIHYLRLKRGNGGLDTYPGNLSTLLRQNSRYNSDPHFKHWADNIIKVSDRTKVPGHVFHPFAPGRAAEKYYAEAGYLYRFARRYRGSEGPSFTRGGLAMPAKITILREGILHPLGRAGYYFLGFADVAAKEGRKDEYFRLTAKLIGEKDNWWRNPVTRSAFRISTGGIFTKPGLYTAGGGLIMYGAGQGVNYAFGENGEGTFVGDGLSTIGRLPANIGLGTANFIADQTWGRIPYMPDMPYDMVLDHLNYEDLTEADIREGLQGVMFDGNTPFHTLPPAQQDAIVRQLAEDDDLSEEHINEVYRNVTTSGGSTTTTRPNGGNGTTTRPNGDDGTTTTTTTTQNGGDGTTTTQNNSSTRTRTYTRRQESGWESAGNVVSNVGNAAFGWLGEGTTSSIGNVLSSSASWIGGFFNKLASGQVRNGEKWLAGGMGLLAALVGGPMITKALGMEGVPFVGLIIAGLIFGFGGGLAHDYMTGQGSGNHRPNRARRTQQDHDGATTTQAPETPETPQTQVLATDNPGDPEYAWDAIRANSTNGQFAVQMSMDSNKESFVDLRVLNPTEVTAFGDNQQSIIDQAKAEGRFISNDRLAGMNLDTFDRWEFTAVETGKVAGTDNGEVLVFAKPDNSNDYVVLELDQPN